MQVRSFVTSHIKLLYSSAGNDGADLIANKLRVESYSKISMLQTCDCMNEVILTGKISDDTDILDETRNNCNTLSAFLTGRRKV